MKIRLTLHQRHAFCPLLVLSALITLAVPSLRAEERMRPGLWEITSLPEDKAGGTLSNTCYTPAMVEFANRPAKDLRESTEKTSAQRGCTVRDFKSEGHTLSMVKICGTRTSAVTSTYSGDTFDTVDTVTERGVKKVMHMKGRRLGDCK